MFVGKFDGPHLLLHVLTNSPHRKVSRGCHILLLYHNFLYYSIALTNQTCKASNQQRKRESWIHEWSPLWPLRHWKSDVFSSDSFLTLKAFLSNKRKCYWGIKLERSTMTIIDCFREAVFFSQKNKWECIVMDSFRCELSRICSAIKGFVRVSIRFHSITVYVFRNIRNVCAKRFQKKGKI